ncbi:hypothetical protein EDD21DRAFT_154539 [Dissophora ornata]|nr:hypothetical protein BGZ58_009162 [Dissophora ornata]KAI8599666.1 hypothetical protein EDD21DRAFT_154539 [Dissophora ornata]
MVGAEVIEIGLAVAAVVTGAGVMKSIDIKKIGKKDERIAELDEAVGALKQNLKKNNGILRRMTGLLDEAKATKLDEEHNRAQSMRIIREEMNEKLWYEQILREESVRMIQEQDEELQRLRQGHQERDEELHRLTQGHQELFNGMENERMKRKELERIAQERGEEVQRLAQCQNELSEEAAKERMQREDDQRTIQQLHEQVEHLTVVVEKREERMVMVEKYLALFLQGQLKCQPSSAPALPAPQVPVDRRDLGFVRAIEFPAKAWTASPREDTNDASPKDGADDTVAKASADDADVDEEAKEEYVSVDSGTLYSF